MEKANEFSFGARLPLQQPEPAAWLQPYLVAAVGGRIIDQI